LHSNKKLLICHIASVKVSWCSAIFKVFDVSCSLNRALN